MIIHRYELTVGDNVLEVPDSAEPVCLAARDGDPPECVQLWVCVSERWEKEPKKHARYFVAATGESVTGRYLGTALVLGGRLVWHVFEQG